MSEPLQAPTKLDSELYMEANRQKPTVCALDGRPNCSDADVVTCAVARNLVLLGYAMAHTGCSGLVDRHHYESELTLKTYRISAPLDAVDEVRVAYHH